MKHLTQQPVPLVEAFPQCPPELSKVVLRALSPAREDRQDSMEHSFQKWIAASSPPRRKSKSH